jgi:hypothetical protein
MRDPNGACQDWKMAVTLGAKIAESYINKNCK